MHGLVIAASISCSIPLQSINFIKPFFSDFDSIIYIGSALVCKPTKISAKESNG